MVSANPLPHGLPVVSIPRITILVASLLVTMGCGTSYLYSAYSPQLGARLHITHSQLNVIGMAGNVGGYIGSPIWGKFVDSRGPRFPFASAFVLLFVGYYGIRHAYEVGVPVPDSTLSPFRFYLVVFCNFMAGLGASAGATSAVNSTAKTFPDSARGLATGLVISGYGLSAFLFSTISHLAFSDDTSSFLLLLAIGSAFPMIVGFFVIRHVPSPSESTTCPENGVVDAWFDDTEMIETSTAALDHDSQSQLLPEDDAIEAMPDSQMLLPAHSHKMAPPSTKWLESSRISSLDVRESWSGKYRSGKGIDIPQVDLPNIYGWKLLVASNFWLLSSIVSVLGGTGVMYINNVGSMTQALLAKGNPSYDETEASRWQTVQVSSISIMSFSGRILIGFVSDFAKNKLRLPRSSCLVLISFILVISQIIAANVDDISRLWIPSALLGLGYGSFFSLFPTLCIEWFGLPHFSENGGYLTLSLMFPGYLFSAAFGHNLDAHGPSETQLAQGESAPATLSNPQQCLEGRECYVDVLYLTILACSLTGALSAWAGWRDCQMIVAAIPRKDVDLAWEDPED